MARRVFIDPWRDAANSFEFEQNIRSEIPYKVDFSASASDRGTSVSSVAWTSEGSRGLTITNKAVASGVASADVSSPWSGYGRVRVEATYADGNTESVYLEVRVVDPEYL